ncbi:MAG: hypothetical protein ACN6N0_04265 [Microvirgula sp.]
MRKKLKNPEFVQRVKWLIDTRFDGIPARLSDATGVSKAGLSKILNSGTQPFSRTVTKLVEGTGCARDWLLEGDGEPFPDMPCPLLATGHDDAPQAGSRQQQRFAELYGHVCAMSGALPAAIEPERLARGIAIAARAAMPDSPLEPVALEKAIVVVETTLVQRGLQLTTAQRAVMALSCYQLNALAGGSSFDDILHVLLEDHVR